ncbi:hypothetical protein D3C72_1739680 [compost metagenome]
MTFSEMLVPSIWPRMALSRPSFRLARRDPTEKAATFELAAVPTTLSSGGSLKTEARKICPFFSRRTCAASEGVASLMKRWPAAIFGSGT